MSRRNSPLRLRRSWPCLTRTGDEDSRSFWKRVASGKAPLDADTVEYRLADILDLARTMDREWPSAIRRQLKGHKQHPSEKDLFATCLRACMASIQGTKVVDVFTPAKNRSGGQLVADLYPTPPDDIRP